MGSRRERSEVSIIGGRPWGFSLKGGLESNKPLTISKNTGLIFAQTERADKKLCHTGHENFKLEKGGKAESAGLFVGDILHSINSVPLTGSRNEAVQLVKTSGTRLTIEVERGSFSSRARPYSVGPGTFPSRIPLPLDEDQMSYESRSRPSSQILDPDQSEARTESIFSRSSNSPSNLSASTSSINERAFSPPEGAHFETASNASEHLRISNSDIRDSMRGFGSRSSFHSDTSQPTVRLRSKKARDRGFPTERPRSWHASKHPDPAYVSEESMRSPGSGYLAGPAPVPRYHHQPNVGPQRRSKGWFESGDLKSSLRPEVNGSRDSLISGDSHRSHRSGRLSVSSSRSSGTMSSSRGSLDNLLDSGGQASRYNLESHPQPVVMSSKSKQPPHQQVGIVSQKTNIFERLSHESNLEANRGSREDLDRIHRIRQPLDDVEKRHQEMARSPLQQSHFSFSPPPASKSPEKSSMRKKSHDEHVTRQDSNQKMRVSPPVSSGITYSDAKIVKTTSIEPHRHSQQGVPEPPQRDGSSAMAVKSHIRPGLQNEKHHRLMSTSPPSAYSRSPPHGRPMHHHSASTSHLEPIHQIIEKTIEGNAGRQERIFGVMSVGASANIVATSVTVSPKANADKVARKSSLPDSKDPVSRYQNVKDFAKVENDAKKLFTDYLSRAEMRADETSPEQSTTSTTDHTKSHSDDSTESKSTGKYGSVWKTPQTQHNRDRSANFSTVLQDWTDRESDKPKSVSITDSKESEMNYRNKKMSDTTSPQIQTSPVIFSRHSPTENTSSVLRSLQNTQREERRSKNCNSENYEKLWLSESKNEPKPAKKSGSSADYKDWRKEYKDAGQDEQVEDPFSPSDRYVDDIKGMSRKVLRETSLKRRDLGVSPSSQTFAQKKMQFQYPPESSNSVSFHPRSRSFGNELDEESESTPPVKGRKSQVGGKPRPKSAGVFRPRTERPTPANRNLPVASRRQKIDHRKSDSMPDDGSASLGPEDLERLANSNGAQNRRISIDVKPYSAASGRTNEVKSNRRSEVIDFFSRKTAKSFDSATPGHYTSMININTTSYDETPEKHRNEREKTIMSSEDRSKKLRSPPDYLNGSRVQNLIENEAPKYRYKSEHGSVRKLKNFKETREKFKGLETPLSRAKSTSSLLDDDSPKNGVLNQSSSMIKSGDRSSSLENLLDCRSDNLRAPSSHGINNRDMYPTSRDHRSKSSPLITPLVGKGEGVVVPPPRTRTKNHRQRISNSSSASSATTISTLSSFSSSSSASIGIFPTVGEETEKSPKRLSPPQEVSSSSSASSSEVSSQTAAEDRPAPRIPIDTGTYRVKKPKGAESRLKSRRSADNLPSAETVKKTENEETFSAPPESLISERPLSGTSTTSDTYSKSTVAPPPSTSPPLDGAGEKLLKQLVKRRKSTTLPPPPGVSAKLISFTREHIEEESPIHSKPSEERKSSTPEIMGTDEPDYVKRASSGQKYENVHLKEGNQQYENVFGHETKPQVPDPDVKQTSKPDETVTKDTETAQNQDAQRQRPSISSEPLLPDVTFLPESVSPATLEEEHPDLTRDIIKGDKALAQVLTTSSKKAIDYMTGVLSQPSHHIVEEGMRYRRRKPGQQTPEKQPQFETLIPRSKRLEHLEDLLAVAHDPLLYLERLRNDITGRDNLPASSTYYKTSASKAKILNLMKEKLADGEIADEEQETLDEINHKKVELVLSINSKLDDLQSMKGLLEVEMRENECLGKQVANLTKSMCTAKEQEKYNILVQEVDKIINLLLGLSGRLARVENTIQMLHPDADKQEMEILCEKRKKLTEQHNDAKMLKESIDKRQKTVSEILAGYFDQEQFADYEHYIKMKSALIMEQRELDDKTKLGQEQIQCLRESLPEEWQNNLDKLLEE